MFNNQLCYCIKIFIFIALSLSLFTFSTLAIGSEAKTQRLDYDGLSFHALSVDANKVNLHWKDQSGQSFRYLSDVKKQLVAANKTVIALMNAGIYGKNNEPAGLHIENGQVLHALNTAKGRGNFHIQPNGVFLIDEQGRAKVVTTATYQKYEQKKQNTLKLATQSGPMLVINGQLNSRLLPKSKSTYTRNGVCTTKDGKLLFIETDNVRSNFYQFARASQQFGCHNTLYLDGSISKLYVAGENSAFHFSTFVGILSVSEPK